MGGRESSKLYKKEYELGTYKSVIMCDVCVDDGKASMMIMMIS